MLTPSWSPSHQVHRVHRLDAVKEHSLRTDDPAAVRRLCVATDELSYSNGFNSFQLRGSSRSRLSSEGSPSRRSASKGQSSPMAEGGATGTLVREPTARVPNVQPLPALPPVEETPPMSLEILVQMPRWQQRRGPQMAGAELAHIAAAAQLSSTPSLPSMRLPVAGGSSPSAARSASTASLPKAAGASARGKGAEKENTLGSAARELMEARKAARERRYRMSSTFTDGRRRAALMRCMENIEQNGMEPTLAELSKQLSQGGWQEEEVQDHLLLAANDPGGFKIKSNREINEAKPETHYGVLPEIVGMCSGSAVEHTKNAMQLRSTIDGFREQKSAAKEQKAKARRRPRSRQ